MDGYAAPAMAVNLLRTYDQDLDKKPSSIIPTVLSILAFLLPHENLTLNLNPKPENGKPSALNPKLKTLNLPVAPITYSLVVSTP